MKTTHKLLFLLLMLLSGSAFADEVTSKASWRENPVENIDILPSRFQNLFVFKVSKEFKGALVEVYFSNGDLVATQSVAKRKMIINFCDVKSGVYTIRVIKNNRVEEFKYTKK